SGRRRPRLRDALRRGLQRRRRRRSEGRRAGRPDRPRPLRPQPRSPAARRPGAPARRPDLRDAPGRERGLHRVPERTPGRDRPGPAAGDRRHRSVRPEPVRVAVVLRGDRPDLCRPGRLVPRTGQPDAGPQRRDRDGRPRDPHLPRPAGGRRRAGRERHGRRDPVRRPRVLRRIGRLVPQPRQGVRSDDRRGPRDGFRERRPDRLHRNGRGRLSPGRRHELLRTAHPDFQRRERRAGRGPARPDAAVLFRHPHKEPAMMMKVAVKRTLVTAALGAALALGGAVSPAGAQLVERFGSDPLERTGGIVFYPEGNVAARFDYVMDGPHFPTDRPGTLRVLYDTTLPAGRISTPIGRVLTSGDEFEFGAILTIRSEGLFADPNGFSQVAFGLWNAHTTGMNRAGFPSDAFDLVGFDYFPNVGEFG